jgi:hypothetical protein
MKAKLVFEESDQVVRSQDKSSTSINFLPYYLLFLPTSPILVIMASTLRSHLGFLIVTGVGLFSDGYLNITIA